MKAPTNGRVNVATVNGIIQIMPNHKDFPGQAEASIQKSNDALRRADDKLEAAIARQEAIEAEMDTADETEHAILSERHQSLDLEINGLREDFSSAERYHVNNVSSWGY